MHKRFTTSHPGRFPLFQRWISNMQSSSNLINHGDPDLILKSDASKEGNSTASGLWGPNDQRRHTNVLEMKGASLSLESFASHNADKHILLMLDNKRDVANIYKKICREWFSALLNSSSKGLASFKLTILICKNLHLYAWGDRKLLISNLVCHQSHHPHKILSQKCPKLTTVQSLSSKHRNSEVLEPKLKFPK